MSEATEKLACLGCDAVSTKAAWKKNNGTCPKCKKSSKGVAEDSVTEGDEDPCWKDYKQVGMKKKGSKNVPNCVPKEEMEIESYFNKLIGEWDDDRPETSLEKNKRKLADLRKLKAEMWGTADKQTLQAIQQRESELKQAIQSQTENSEKSDDSACCDTCEKSAVSETCSQCGCDPKNPDPDCDCAAHTEDEGLEEQQTKLSEFILSFYDRATGAFPKGETAVLTMVEKDYGEEFIEPAKAFIESVNQTFEQYQPKNMEHASYEQAQEQQDGRRGEREFVRMRSLAGL